MQEKLTVREAENPPDKYTKANTARKINIMKISN